MSVSLPRRVYSIVMAVRTVMCVINLHLGYYQPTADYHYILDLRPEYGGDILQIASTVLHGFTLLMSFISKIKRQFWHYNNEPANHYILDFRPEYGNDVLKIARTILHSLIYVLSFVMKRCADVKEYGTFVSQEEAIVFVGPLQNTDRTDNDTVLWIFPGGQIRLYDNTSVPLVSQETLVFLKPIQDTDTTNDVLVPINCPGKSTFLVVLSDETIVPAAAVTRLHYLEA